MGKLFKTSGFELLCWGGNALSHSVCSWVTPRDTPEKKVVSSNWGAAPLVCFGGSLITARAALVYERT